jgi:spermidine/putrescine transport system ATP-binding protein
MSEFAVELRGVSKSFGARHAAEVNAVSEIDLSIRSGEFFTLLGPSGCGKTTTLRLIAGFELPTTGEVLIQNERMSDVPAHLRPVNTVFQSYALFPHLTVEENVGFGLCVKRVPRPERRTRVDEALRLVRMEAMAGRRPSALSGGQQQRVALARALVNRPSVLLLDEPLGALDLKLRKEMQIELKHMQRQLGITFVFVTHDQEEALTMSDRIAVMHRGRVLQVDDPVGIYERPTTRFGADFIGEMNFIEGRVREVRGADLTIDAAGVRITVPAPQSSVTPGQSITLAIRPEALRLLPPGQGNVGDGQLCLEGGITEEIYIGTDRRYAVQLAGGESLLVRVQNAGTAAAPAALIGETRRICCRTADIRALTE